MYIYIIMLGGFKVHGFLKMGSIENTLPLNPMVKVTFLAKPKSGLNPSKVQTSLHHGEHGHLSQYLPQVLPQDMGQEGH
jgi:hypothetical protein